MSILPPPKLVVIESPFRATEFYSQEQNRLYLLHCVADSIRRGECPFASHVLLPEVLDDSDPYERQLGVRCGYEWGKYADLVAVYSDLSVSQGMKDAIAHWKNQNKIIEWRRLPDKVVNAVKCFGEFNGEPDETPPDSPDTAVSFIGS